MPELEVVETARAGAPSFAIRGSSINSVSLDGNGAGIVRVIEIGATVHLKAIVPSCTDSIIVIVEAYDETV